MMARENSDAVPPAPWWDAYECPREDCEETRYTNLGMDFHLVHDHDGRGVESPAEQLAEKTRQVRGADAEDLTELEDV
jgi:hypothetical protein